jgi:hypothetical protein
MLPLSSRCRPGNFYDALAFPSVDRASHSDKWRCVGLIWTPLIPSTFPPKDVAKVAKGDQSKIKAN